MLEPDALDVGVSGPSPSGAAEEGACQRRPRVVMRLVIMPSGFA